MDWIRKHKSLWEFLILWGAWMLIIFALTDMNQHLERFASRAMVSFVGFFIIIQTNARYLFPKLYLQKKQGQYFLASFILIASTTLLLNYSYFPWSSWFEIPNMPVLEEIERRNSDHIKWFREIMHLLIALLGSTIIGISRYANKKEKEASSLKTEKLETELKFLKSQVNPHFLFNALNNIYSLSVLQSPQAPESVMQLSEILRYMVYESNEASVPLKSEINYIQNFIDLQMLKDSRGMNVQIDLDKSDTDLRVAPLLFIPFVENAFKHSKIECIKEGFINISLAVDKKEIIFRCINNKPKEDFTKDRIGGVGLSNTKQRLNLLYPNNQHDLTINDSDDKFEVILIIKLT